MSRTNNNVTTECIVRILNSIGETDTKRNVIYMHTHTYTIHTHIYIHTCTHTHMYTHIQIHTHTRTHTYIHTYIYIHTHMQLQLDGHLPIHKLKPRPFNYAVITLAMHQQ